MRNKEEVKVPCGLARDWGVTRGAGAAGAAGAAAAGGL